MRRAYLLILITMGAIGLESPAEAGPFKRIRDMASKNRTENAVTLRLRSNQDETVFLIDGEEVGVGQFLTVEIAADREHIVRAAPKGYDAKTVPVAPPLSNPTRLDFYFMKSDRQDYSPPHRRVSSEELENILGLICNRYLDSGTTEKLKGQGQLEGALHDGRVMIEGYGTVDLSGYMGPSQDQIGDEIKDNRDCRLSVWNDLKERRVDD